MEFFLPDTIFLKFHAFLITKVSPNIPLFMIWKYLKKIERILQKNIKHEIFGEMEKSRYIKNNLGTKNSFNKRLSNFQTIPKNDKKTNVTI